MKFLAFLAAALIVIVVGRAFFSLRGNRLVERNIGELAVVRVPARFDPRTPRSTWVGTTLHLTRSMNSFAAMGSNSPQHENLAVTQIEPRQVARLGNGVLRHLVEALEYVQEPAWDAPITRGDGTIRVGTGRYEVNLLKEPAWLAQAFDPKRGIAVTYRVNQKKAKREDVIALVDAVMASYELKTGLAEHFSAIHRELGAGISIVLPIELTDPFPWEFEPDGVTWMYYRRFREWADNTETPEQTTAVAAFFAPGDPTQAQSARKVLEREMRKDLGESATLPNPASPNAINVAELEHLLSGRREPSWLVTAIDSAKGIGLVYRVWKRDADQNAARAVVERAIGAYQFAGENSFFAPRTAKP